MRLGLVTLSRYNGVQVYTAPNWPDRFDLVCLTCRRKKDSGQFVIQEYFKTRICYRVHCLRCLKRFGEAKRFREHALYSPELHDALAARLVSARGGATSRGLMFDLNIGQLFRMFYEQNGMCAISGVPMTYDAAGSKNNPHNVSIDRIDSRFGYTPANAQLVCFQVNLMKMEMNLDQLRYWCAHITLNQSESDDAEDASSYSVAEAQGLASPEENAQNLPIYPQCASP